MLTVCSTAMAQDFNVGSAVGTIGTKQDGPALIVTDKDGKEIILYSPKKVEYIKVKDK